MQVTETKSEGLTREYKVALPAKDIEDKISRRLQELTKTVTLPGFRPGKVPVSVLRQKYGPSVMGEILERAVNESSQQAMTEKGLRPAMQPEIEITSFEAGKDLEYTISVEILPEITPTDFSKIKVERLVPNTNQAEIDTALENLAKSHGESKTLSENRKSKDGDVLLIDFLGRVDGVEFAGGKAEGYELTLGTGTFIPGFEEQLTGVKACDKVDVKVTFPENYGAAELSGKDAVFEVTVHELKETVPAAIDDELAKKVGMESLDTLKKSIQEEQEREFKNMARMTLKRELLDKLAETHDFEVPGKLLEREYESIWSQYEERRKTAAASGQPAPDDNGKSEDEQKQDFHKIAERRVRLGLLMSEVGRVNNVEISQEDINRQLMAEAKSQPGREQEVIEYFKNNPQAMEQLSAPVYEEKVVDFILEKATVTDKKATKEDLIKALETNDEDKPKAKAKSQGKSKSKPKTAPKTDKTAKKKPAKKD